MANVDNPHGFVPVGTTDGSDYAAKMMEVAFLATDATACFLNDMLTLTGETTADGLRQVVTRASAGDALIGSLVSLEPDFSDESFLSAGNLRLASTARNAKVMFGSDVIYSAQSSTTLVAADAGQNADIVTGTGDTITGISGSEIGAAIGAGATGQVRLMSVDRQVNNEIGADANWLCFINEYQFDHGTGV